MGGEVKNIYIKIYKTWGVTFKKKEKKKTKRKIVHHVHAVVNEGGEVG